MTLRRRIYNILENDRYDSPASRWIGRFLIALIVANVLAVVASSVHSWHVQYRDYFAYFENFSLIVFSIEFVLRVWAVAESHPHDTQGFDINKLAVNHSQSAWQKRWQWLTSPSAIIDFVAIFPAYVNFFVPMDLRFLIVLRVLRLFKLTRYFVALRILLKVLAREKEAFKAVLFILVVLIILAASGIYLVENKAQPDKFGSIPQAMWWAVVTLTTVGYGDVTPVTTAGKVLGAVITILGVGLAALPAGILASGLANELSGRREQLENQLREKIVASDIDLDTVSWQSVRKPNEMTHAMLEAIETMRKELGLTHEQANTVVAELLKEQHAKPEYVSSPNFYPPNFCPHCGHGLGHYKVEQEKKDESQ